MFSYFIKLIVIRIDYFLPANLKPRLYELTLKTYVGTNVTYGDKAFTYEGNMIIHFDCAQPTNKIVFHASEISINASALQLTLASDGSESPILGTEYEEEREFYTVNLNDNCIANRTYKLSIEYSAKIRADLNGFYISSYIDQNGIQN